jgi:hypothetical protein
MFICSSQNVFWLFFGSTRWYYLSTFFLHPNGCAFFEGSRYNSSKRNVPLSLSIFLWASSKACIAIGRNKDCYAGESVSCTGADFDTRQKKDRREKKMFFWERKERVKKVEKRGEVETEVRS